MMIFELKPILAIIKELYQQPLSPERFQNYLAKLQGSSKGDLELPIGGYNPMAKEHVMEKIAELEALKAEDLMAETLKEINSTISSIGNRRIQCVLNLADDLKGGWTNRYTTDFDSKFKINALVERDFCTPYFWTSEIYSKELIINRCKAYAFRTLFWIENGKLLSLKDHLAQENYVWNQINGSGSPHGLLEKYSQQAKEFEKEDDYNLLFNFFYGDAASESLAYPTFGFNRREEFPFADS